MESWRCHMKYTKEQRIEIGRQVYTQEVSHRDAMKKYGIVSSCVDNYVRLFKIENGIPTNCQGPNPISANLLSTQNPYQDIELYKTMSKEELINELILAKANELRAKKGYEVKGVGANKEYISLNNKNTKS